MFFLIKFSVSIAIQLKFGLESMQMLDIVLVTAVAVILLIYLVLLKFKKPFFSTLTEKINEPYKYQVTNCLREFTEQKMDLKTFYLLFLIFTNVVSSVCLVFLNNYFWWHVIPIMLNLIGLGMVWTVKFYNHSNIYRTAWNYFAGVSIQSFLLLKHYNNNNDISSPGVLELSSSIYLPLTVFILSLITTMLSLSFYLYSIKKIRCCNLHI